MSIKKASLADKEWIVAVISNAFQENRSVNWVVKNDTHTSSRIENLIRYAFDKSFRPGGALVNSEKTGAVLFLDTGSKTNAFLDVANDIELAFRSVGLSRVYKVLKRERYVKNLHPKEPHLYLWFIGVKKTEQGIGIGSSILDEVCRIADKKRSAIYLETSEKNILPLYLKSKFTIHHTWSTEFLGFPLWFLKREPQ